jgi:predicted transcriptional regulator
MSDANQSKTLKQLKLERAEAVEPAQEWLKTQQQTRKLIRKALGKENKTVPEVSSETNLPSHVVLWHLMAMKKYDLVEETELDGQYYRYQLKQEKP